MNTLISDICRNFKFYENKNVSIRGRITSKRICGKVAFYGVENKGKSIQIYVRRDDIGENAYSDFKLCNVGDEVFIQGMLFRSKSGEIFINAERYLF